MLMMHVLVAGYWTFVIDGMNFGPGFGYFPNACKTWLVTKDRCRTEAETVFAGTNVKLTSEG